MSAINPKHKLRVILDFYTSHPITAEQFEYDVVDATINAEVFVNTTYPQLRLHAKMARDVALRSDGISIEPD